MPNFTPNYNLVKPLGPEQFDEGNDNSNMDLIDAAIKTRQNNIDAAVARITTLEADSGRPRCKIRATANQTLVSSAVSKVTMGSTDYDTNAMANLTNDRIIFKTVGWYICAARLDFTTNGNGGRLGLIQKNGVNYISEDYRMAYPSGNDTIFFLKTEPILFAINDYIELVASQESGGNLALALGNGNRCWLSAHLFSKA